MNKRKKRNLIIIIVVVVIGLATLLIVAHGSKKSTFEQNYHIADTSTITKIFMADKQDNTILLEHHEDACADSAWIINKSYVASQPMVDLLLETLNTMRIRQQVNKNAVPSAIKNLSARSTKVEVYQKVPFINWFGGRFQLFKREKKTVTYFIGHETQDNMGTYMYREGDKVPYIVHIPGFRGYISPRFVTDETLWRSHKIVDMDVREIAEVKLEIPANPAESFAIKRQGEGFGMELLQGNVNVPTFDTARVAQMLLSFKNLNFDEYAKAVPQVELDTTFSKAPRTILSITDTTGYTRQLKTYIKYNNPEDITKMPNPEMYEIFDLDRLYAVIDNKDTVLIQYYAFDNILQPASFFIGKDLDINYVK